MSILCLTSRTTVTSARIPDEDACHRARNLCVFSRVQKGTPGLTHKGCVLQRFSLGALSDVTVVLGMRQSIDAIHNAMITAYASLKNFYRNATFPVSKHTLCNHFLEHMICFIIHRTFFKPSQKPFNSLSVKLHLNLF